MSDEPTSDGCSDHESDDGRLSISETQDLYHITQSREATIAAFFSYFEFLTTMVMDPELVQMPPEGGWPEISVDSMHDLGTTDEVVELLRRLPYTRSPSGDEGKAGEGDGGGFTLTDWTKIARDRSGGSRPDSSSTLDCYRNRTEGSYGRIPPHVVGLVFRSPFDLFLDTQLGVVYSPGDVYVPSPTIRAQQADAPFRPVADDAEDYAVRRGRGRGLAFRSTRAEMCLGDS